MGVQGDQFKVVENADYERAWQVSDLEALQVHDRQGNLIGAIGDVEVNLGQGQIDAFYIRTGGFMGLGQTTVRVPADKVDITRQNDMVIARVDRDSVKQISQRTENRESNIQEWGNFAVKEAETEAKRAEQEAIRLRQRADSARQYIGDYENFKRRSNELTKALRQQVSRNGDIPEADMQNVRVIAHPNRWVLSGVVATDEYREAIEEAAEDLDEEIETFVVNEIRVRNQTTQVAQNQQRQRNRQRQQSQENQQRQQDQQRQRDSQSSEERKQALQERIDEAEDNLDTLEWTAPERSEQYAQKAEAWADKVEEAIEDGEFTADERRRLFKARMKLELEQSPMAYNEFSRINVQVDDDRILLTGEVTGEDVRKEIENYASTVFDEAFQQNVETDISVASDRN